MSRGGKSGGWRRSLTSAKRSLQARGRRDPPAFLFLPLRCTLYLLLTRSVPRQTSSGRARGRARLLLRNADGGLRSKAPCADRRQACLPRTRIDPRLALRPRTVSCPHSFAGGWGGG